MFDIILQNKYLKILYDTSSFIEKVQQSDETMNKLIY